MGEKMWAAVLHGVRDMRHEMIEIPEISRNEVLIRVKFVGVCGSDLPRAMVSGLSGGASYPLILGHEFSGEVYKIGDEVKNFAVGNRVTVAPLIPCGVCEYCKEGSYGLCEDYKIIGTRVDGAMAEYVKVPQEHVLKLPDSLDFETAAGIEPATIAYHGVAKANIKPGDSVAVLGCGPIGQFAVQWARVFGAARVFAVDIFAEKLQLAEELGATDTVNAKEQDPTLAIKALTGLGVDAVIETAGSKFTQEQAINLAKKHGRIVYVGISHSELPLKAASAENILRSELQISGSWNSYTTPYPGRAWHATIDFMSRGNVVFKPMVSHTIDLAEVGTYLENMADRKINFNKVLVKI